MKQVSLFSQVAAISIGVFLFLAVLLGVSHAADGVLDLIGKATPGTFQPSLQIDGTARSC